jgi:hypothetical protein
VASTMKGTRAPCSRMKSLSLALSWVMLILLLVAMSGVNASCDPNNANACTAGSYCTNNGGGGYVCRSCTAGQYCVNSAATSCSTTSTTQAITCNSFNCPRGMYFNSTVSTCLKAPTHYFNPLSTNGNLYYCDTATLGLVGQGSCLSGIPINNKLCG